MSRHDPHRVARHAQTRRLKKLLRFTPRRAVFHRYPIVGRFAASARRRAYLWSFKPAHVRPAIYIGTVLSLWPTLGIQLILALALSLFARANFMVTGGLQFITNPLTAAPIYYLTYRVGRFVMQTFGLRESEAPDAAPALEEPVTIDLSPSEALPARLDWAAGFGSSVIALFIGGTLCGLLLAVVLDFLYTMGFRLGHPPPPARRRPASAPGGAPRP